MSWNVDLRDNGVFNKRGKHNGAICSSRDHSSIGSLRRRTYICILTEIRIVCLRNDASPVSKHQNSDEMCDTNFLDFLFGSALYAAFKASDSYLCFCQTDKWHATWTLKRLKKHDQRSSTRWNVRDLYHKTQAPEIYIYIYLKVQIMDVNALSRERRETKISYVGVENKLSDSIRGDDRTKIIKLE